MRPQFPLGCIRARPPALHTIAPVIPTAARPCPELHHAVTALHAIDAWPRRQPLGALVSAGGHPHARWSILTRPGPHIPISCASEITGFRFGCAPIRPDEHNLPWFQGGWIIQLDYEFGARIDPGPRFREVPGPLGSACRVDWGLVRDEARGAWFEFGQRPSDFDLGALARTEPAPSAARLSPLESESGKAIFESNVARAIAYIRAGDVFQVNLAHHLVGDFTGDARRLASVLLARSTPRFGAYLETPHARGARSIISLSPERFLSLSAAGRLRARPMKGTRAIETDPRELDASPKDRAELDMIIDLMRNDLGRVSRLGSVRVAAPRIIEAHGRVWQASAEVEGELRAGLTLRDIVEAAFPPGSVTGAPKYRAREIIDELEPRARGPYCGCIGALSDTGAAEFSVAIRTLTLDGEQGEPGNFRSAAARYPVGAGIVVESDARAEWEETLHKASAVRSGMAL